MWCGSQCIPWVNTHWYGKEVPISLNLQSHIIYTSLPSPGFPSCKTLNLFDATASGVASFLSMLRPLLPWLLTLFPSPTSRLTDWLFQQQFGILPHTFAVLLLMRAASYWWWWWSVLQLIDSSWKLQHKLPPCQQCSHFSASFSQLQQQ